MSKISIYVIVVTYNGSKWIDKCFGSLINSSIPIKILAIDNASTDRTPQIIREKFTQVEVIETGKNLGFGKANNIGLKRVLDEKIDYAFLLNQDAWVEKDTIEKLIEIHKAHPEFGLLSPVPYDGNGDKLDRQFKKFYSQPHNIDEIISANDSKLYEVSFINAAGWLLPLSTINQVGYFHEIFFQRGEDIDYTNRCIFHQKKIGFHSGTKYYHDRNEALDITYTTAQYKQSLQIRLLTQLNNINLSVLNRIINCIFLYKPYFQSYKLNFSNILHVYIKVSLRAPFILYKSSQLKKVQHY
jgi:GT2 family glycosyltransferase